MVNCAPMGTPTPLSPDTSAEAEAAYFARLRMASPGDRVLTAIRLAETVDALARAGIRERHPRARERELFLRLAALKLDRAAMIAAYGWDPEKRGY